MIVTLANTKGGVGKTTIAANIAISVALTGARVLLVDGDPQATATLFSRIREEDLGAAGYDLEQWTGEELYDGVLLKAPGYDLVVVDVGGFDSAAMRGALLVSQKVLIPVGPRSFDLWALDRMVDLVQEARSHNPDLLASVFINGADAQGQDNAQLREAVEEIPEVRFVPAMIGRRKAFANSAASGLSVLETRPRDRRAVEELVALMSETIGYSGKKG